MPIKKQKLKTIKDACVKANPDIMKLPYSDEDIEFLKEQLRRCSYTEDIRDAQYDLNRAIEENRSSVGRDIRLADIVLMLAREVKPNPELEMHSLQISISKRSTHGRDNCLWNLLKDNLEEQSNETIDFIYQLIK